MWMRLVYLKLELKRAGRRLLHLYAGAIMLLLMAGVIALLASRVLYSDQIVGRVAVGVSLPQDDALAKQVMKMISSLESVNSVCDFQYMDRESCLEELENGNLYAVLDIPEGFVQDIINGTNTPITVWLARDTGLEGKLFQELTDAGALTLSASQAGIYAGNELYHMLGLSEAIGELESELNRQYMDYSLGRTGYFRHLNVQSSGDVGILEFYEISMYVLFLFLAAIPVSGYLLPLKKAVRQKLTAAGIGPGYQTGARIVAVWMLLGAVTGPVIAAAAAVKLVDKTMVLAAVWLLSCAAAAAVVVLVYQLAGTLLGGIMLLFFVMTGQHFLAGGFLPSVFLPRTIQTWASWLPSGVLIDTMKMAVTGQWKWRCVLGCVVLAVSAWLFSTLLEVARR